jgi:transcriptional antiterminator Rof (Rho-off)
MNLLNYFQKNVTLTDIDGVVWHGKVETYTSAADSEENVEEIAIMTDEQGLTGFRIDEIKSISII